METLLKKLQHIAQCRSLASSAPLMDTFPIQRAVPPTTTVLMAM